jgi:hypothetical protein
MTNPDLEAENARLRDDILILANRLAICSELLSKAAGKNGVDEDVAALIQDGLKWRDCEGW